MSALTFPLLSTEVAQHALIQSTTVPPSSIKKMAVRRSRILDMAQSIFNNLSSYLSYRDLSSWVLVKRDQTAAQAALRRDPLPCKDPAVIAKYNEKSELLLQEMDGNFPIHSSIQNKIKEIKKLSQPFKYLHLQIFASFSCIKQRRSKKEVATLEAEINTCTTIPDKRRVLYKAFQPPMSMNDALMKTIDYMIKENYGNDRAISLAEALLDMGASPNFSLRHHSPTLFYTPILQCLHLNAKGHLRLLIERGANLNLPGDAVMNKTPLIRVYDLETNCFNIAVNAVVEKVTIRTLLEYLPDPFKRVTLYEHPDYEPKPPMSAIEYVHANILNKSKESNVYDHHKSHQENLRYLIKLDRKIHPIFWIYIDNYSEIMATLNRCLPQNPPDLDLDLAPQRDFSGLVLSYIRS